MKRIHFIYIIDIKFIKKTPYKVLPQKNPLNRGSINFVFYCLFILKELL